MATEHLIIGIDVTYPDDADPTRARQAELDRIAAHVAPVTMYEHGPVGSIYWDPAHRAWVCGVCIEAARATWGIVDLGRIRVDRAVWHDARIVDSIAGETTDAGHIATTDNHGEQQFEEAAFGHHLYCEGCTTRVALPDGVTIS